MPPDQNRKITRNRQSLSCARCRLRKVRCGREQPECNNCIKTGELCVYGARLIQERVQSPSASSREESESFQVEEVPGRNTPQYQEPGTSDGTTTLVQAERRLPENAPQILLGANIQRLSMQAQHHATIPPRIPGYISTKDDIRPRFLQSTFWASIPDQTSLCDIMFPQNCTRKEAICPGSTVDEYIDMAALLTSCKKLPNRLICDLLIHQFLIGVQPIYALIDVQSFFARYISFWEWCETGATSALHSSVLRDKSFFPLLFSVLYCSAVTQPSHVYGTIHYKDYPRTDTIRNLNELYSGGLVSCQYTRHPTLNTLVALLLGHSCSIIDSEPVDDAHFAGLVLRMAQTLGLHLEQSIPGQTQDTELRRRVWWHIVWLDVQASIHNGLPVSFGSTYGQYSTAMAQSTLSDGFSKAPITKISAIPSPSSEGGKSAFVLFAIARYETARFEHSVIESTQSVKPLVQADLDYQLSEIQHLHRKLEAIVAQLPVNGIPERGFMASRIADASPVTHRWMYADQTNEPTVFTSWARIVLTMYKAESSLRLLKAFIAQPGAQQDQRQKIWSTMMQLCLSYLQNYIHVFRTPSFAIYRWLFLYRLPPIEPIFLALTWIRRGSSTERTKAASYCVNEIFQLLEKEVEDPHIYTSEEIPLKQLDYAWKKLKELHTEIVASGRREQAFQSLDLDTHMPDDFTQTTHTTAIDVSSLEAWSSSLIGSEDTLAMPVWEASR